MDSKIIRPDIRQMLRDQDHDRLSLLINTAGQGAEEAYRTNMYFYKTIDAMMHDIPASKLLLDLSKIIESQQITVNKVVSLCGNPAIMKAVQEELNRMDHE